MKQVGIWDAATVRLRSRRSGQRLWV